MDLNQRHPRVDNSRFAMVPRADVPRSTFRTRHTVKTTFDAGLLIPFHLDEVLPSDVHRARVTIFARLLTLLFPIMDTLTVSTFFFFVPNRLIWTNWRKMMGERLNPADSISYITPQLTSPAGGYAVGSVYDYFGLPTVGQIGGASTVAHSALPLRAYNLIFNEWFRDENLQNQVTVQIDDGPDNTANYSLWRRNKTPDYFTSALPWPLKGGVDVTLPMAGTAPIIGIAASSVTAPTAGNPSGYKEQAGATNNNTGVPVGWPAFDYGSTASQMVFRRYSNAASAPPAIYADLSQATGATINAMRLAVQTQRLLERDARSGTRYTELLRAHFGVQPEDMRLQRPEYIGGGTTNIQTQAIPQTAVDRRADTPATISNPVGALGAAAVAADQHSYSYSATEHGLIIGLIHVGANLTYQQGLHRLWTRQTRYDYYWPVFAHLGEQAIRNDELYVQGSSGGSADSTVFGYQERWSEYKYSQSRLTGLMKSTSANSFDAWHLAIKFTALPVLNYTFIQDTPPLSRVLANQSAVTSSQILVDALFDLARTRPIPMYSTPGMMDRL